MKKEEQSKNSKPLLSRFIAAMRIVAGFTLSPTVGALAFYALMNVPLLFGYELPGISLSIGPSFIIGGVMLAGALFYAPSVIIGLAVMMLIYKYHHWSFVNCTLGGIISAFALSLILMLLLKITGLTLAVASGASLMLLGLITIPSALAGMSFWVIAVYKNDTSELFFQTVLNKAQSPVLAYQAFGIPPACSIPQESGYILEQSEAEGEDRNVCD